MSFFGWARLCAIGVALCLGLTGCLPPADNQVDEKKDPNFIAGKNLVSQMDWNGAIEAFEKALDSNPRSASAHFELGWLYEQKADDPAAAIYHYDRYLKLSASKDQADLVRQHVNSCKLELVKNMAVVGTPGAQRELDRVIAENKNLQAQVAQLQADLASARATAVAVHSSPPPSQPVQKPIANPVAEKTSVNPPRKEPARNSSGTMGNYVSNRVSNSTAVRNHIVRSRETMASIAREYGVSIAALESANPQVRPTHLYVGQSLKIPAP
jgi:LysM repeat protein